MPHGRVFSAVRGMLVGFAPSRVIYAFGRTRMLNSRPAAAGAAETTGFE